MEKKKKNGVKKAGALFKKGLSSFGQATKRGAGIIGGYAKERLKDEIQFYQDVSKAEREAYRKQALMEAVRRGQMRASPKVIKKEGVKAEPYNPFGSIAPTNMFEGTPQTNMFEGSRKTKKKKKFKKKGKAITVILR